MKFSILILVLCTLQSSTVLARNLNEVIEAFRPLILELHNTLGRESEQLVYDEDGQHKLKHFERNIGVQLQNLDAKLEMIQQTIADKVEQIVSETGMTAHEDLITHCYSQKNADIETLIYNSVAGQEICFELAYRDLDSLKTIFNGIRDQQYPMHSTLEDAVRACNRTSVNGSAMTACMVDEFLIKLAPELGHVLKQMKQNVGRMDWAIVEKVNNVNACYNIVADKAAAKIENVTGRFKECCVTASHSN